MNPGKALVALAASGWILSSLTGCCTKEKEQIFQMEARYNDLAKRQADVQQQLSEADQRLDESARQLDEKDQLLRSRDEQIADLNAQLTKTPEPAAGTASGWTPTAVGDMVTVGSDILFAAGRATLTKAGQARLDQIAADMQRNYAGLPVRILGHTDSDPIRKSKKLWTDNLDLSANRAMAVTRYLIRKGISAKTVEAVAMGEHHPVAGNTGSGKAKNRRVEIVVVKQK